MIIISAKDAFVPVFACSGYPVHAMSRLVFSVC